MERCLELARSGLGYVAPNPLVGCVIEHDGMIIGEGYHAYYGASHAEVSAIQSVEKKELLQASTLHVNLEPCSHHGKTPPCTDFIIQHQIPRVVIGVQDHHEKVAGKGIEQLKQAGIQVKTKVLQQEAYQLNKRFFTYHKKQRPYILLKWAQTPNGFLADQEGNPQWISNPYSRILVHKWRAEEDAIMVGTNTALRDNPTLNVRNWTGSNPLRIVIDKDLQLNNAFNLLNGASPTWILNNKIEQQLDKNRWKAFDFTKDWLPDFLNRLYHEGVQSLIVEGGAQLLRSFTNIDYWDEARVFKGAKRFQKGKAVAPEMNRKPAKTSCIGNDQLEIFLKNELTT